MMEQSMRDEDKSKDQLINELIDLRQNLVNLENQSSKWQQAQVEVEKARQQAEDELREIYKRYSYLRSSIQATFIGVGSAAISGDILYANDAALKMVGYESLLELQESGALIIHKNPADRERYYSLLQETGKVDNIELDIVTKSGEFKTLVFSGFLEGDIFTTTFVDITKLKQAEKVLLTNEEHYRQVLSAVSDYAYSMKVNPDQSISLEWLTGNPEKVLGYTEDEFKSGSVRKFALDVTRPEHRDMLNQAFESLMNNERTGSEVQCRRKDGNDIWLRIYRQPIWDTKEQRVVRYYGAVSDITKEKEVEEAYLEQEMLEIALAKEKELRKLRNRYLSTIAHDFRTPLTSINISSDILNKYSYKLTDKQKQVYFERISQGVTYLDNLLDEIGLIARAGRGYLDFKPEMLSPKKVCTRIVNDFIAINESNHEIIYDCSVLVESCCLDESLLRHILMNLLTNAAKYSAKHSKINIRVSKQENDLHFAVSDTGIGIPKEDQARLFDPFYRAGNVGTIKGSGIGLSIVSEMVSAHGGSIHLESHIGVGTTFIITIPIKYEGCKNA